MRPDEKHGKVWRKNGRPGRGDQQPPQRSRSRRILDVPYPVTELRVAEFLVLQDGGGWQEAA